MKKIGLGIAILLFAIIISLCSSGMGLLVIGIGIVGLIFSIIGFMEKIFVPMLVKYFPDQAGEVVKYIRKAGYGDGEVLDLIDRTAGYNSNTAYLYQGKSGEEHRKKLQRKQSGE